VSQNESKKEIKSINEFRESQEESIDRIVVKQGKKIKVIAIETIHYFEAMDDYVMIYTDDGRYMKQKTMKYFESHLPDNEFIRIHRSYIVNVQQIAELERYEKESFHLKLKTGASLKVSKTGYQKLKEKLNM
jgi:two-component system, LytTR family, response regulator